MEVIALYNLKGGVGKTAGCVNLAHLCAQDGFRTLVWDLDPQAAAGFYFDVDAASAKSTKKLMDEAVSLPELVQPTVFENLDVIPADFSGRKLDVMLEEQKKGKKVLKQMLKSLRDDYDFVFIDCPPGFSLLAENIFHAADIVLMPTIPTTLSLRTFEAVKALFEEKKIEGEKLMCYFSMVDSRKTLHTEVMDEFLQQKRFFQSFIPYLSDIEKMGLHQGPVTAYAPQSRAAKAFSYLWGELKEGIL